MSARRLCWYAFLLALVVLSGRSLALELRGRDLPEELGAALTLDLDARLARELGRGEATLGLSVGYEWQLLRTLREAVPEDGLVYALGERAPRQITVFSHAQVLLYPRRFDVLPQVPVRERTTGLDERVFVLELERPPTPQLEGWFEPVAEGEGFRLLRHPEQTP